MLLYRGPAGARTRFPARARIVRSDLLRKRCNFDSTVTLRVWGHPGTVEGAG